MPTVLSIREADTKREGSRSAWATWQYPILKKKKNLERWVAKGEEEKKETQTLSVQWWQTYGIFPTIAHLLSLKALQVSPSL